MEKDINDNETIRRIIILVICWVIFRLAWILFTMLRG